MAASSSLLALSANAHPEEVTIVFYEVANQEPTFFEIPLENGWFIFSQNERFFNQTGYPSIDLMIYDAETEEFKSLLTAGALLVDKASDPCLVIRVYGLRSDQCIGLDICKRHLRDVRNDVQEGHTDFAGTGADGIGLVRGDGIDGIGDNMTIESVSDDSEDGWDVAVRQFMVIDNDANDLDYVDRGSEVADTEEDEGMETEEEEMETEGEAMETEEEAIETDEEVIEADEETIEADEEVIEANVEVIVIDDDDEETDYIDLTGLSDD